MCVAIVLGSHLVSRHFERRRSRSREILPRRGGERVEGELVWSLLLSCSTRFPCSHCAFCCSVLVSVLFDWSGVCGGCCRVRHPGRTAQWAVRIDINGRCLFAVIVRPVSSVDPCRRCEVVLCVLESQCPLLLFSVCFKSQCARYRSQFVSSYSAHRFRS